MSRSPGNSGTRPEAYDGAAHLRVASVGYLSASIRGSDSLLFQSVIIFKRHDSMLHRGASVCVGAVPMSQHR